MTIRRTVQALLIAPLLAAPGILIPGAPQGLLGSRALAQTARQGSDQEAPNQQALDSLQPPQHPHRATHEHHASHHAHAHAAAAAKVAASPPAPAPSPPVPDGPTAVGSTPPIPAAAPPPPVITAPVIAVPLHPEPPPPPVPVVAHAIGSSSPVQGGERITFGKGSADLNAATMQALRDFAAMLRADPVARVDLAAYAPGSPDDPSSPRRLSLARGLAVRAVLINAGIASTRIYVRVIGPASDDGPADRVDLTRQANPNPPPTAAGASPATASPGTHPDQPAQETSQRTEAAPSKAARTP